ncbi:MATE family efflux transporter DinF [Motilimonas pumila]|uniref:MATE family efflux transporter DinF n=1 Tax=Motilimonas pumila TaxID=2303987 RepID=A0A418YHQ4_9GAMM|nr:MATE family efflux transporter DinF [Motilimonas pumila]RJG49489.1 MATE family efflux transporter DinF [Motilimonas pumila]
MKPWWRNKRYYQSVIALALPMILSNVTVPLLGLVDTAVLGHLSESYYLAGVAVGAMCITLAFWMMAFLRMSTTGLVAQARGKHSGHHLKRLLSQSLLTAFGLAGLLILLQQPILSVGLYFSGVTGLVQEYASQYFLIRIWAAPAALANLVILGWLLGMQNAKAPMWLLIITNIVNILLDILFVFGFGWQVKGAAAASLIADYVGLALGLYFVSVLLQPYWHVGDVKKYLLLAWNKSELAIFFALNRDIFIRTLCVQACFAFMTFYGARLGQDIVAANAVLLNFLMFIAFGLDGFAYAIEALVGKSIGQGKQKQLNRWINVTFVLAFILAVIMTSIFAIFGEAIIALITNIESVRELANQYLIWLILIPLTSIWCFILDGIFIGATRAKQMRNSMLVATLVFFFPCWWLFSDYGNHSLWLAMNAFMLGRGVCLGYIYWQLKKKCKFMESNHIS